MAGGLASRLHERGVHNLSRGVSRLIPTPAMRASTALDVTRHFSIASRTEPSQNQIAASYFAAEFDYRRAACTLPTPNIRQQHIELHWQVLFHFLHLQNLMHSRQ